MRFLIQFCCLSFLTVSGAFATAQHPAMLGSMPVHIYGQAYEWKPYREQVPYHYQPTVIECNSYLGQKPAQIIKGDDECIGRVQTVLMRNLGNHYPHLVIDLEVMHNESVNTDGSRSPCWDTFPDETRGNLVNFHPDHLYVRVNCDKDSWHGEEKIEEYLKAALK